MPLVDLPASQHVKEALNFLDERLLEGLEACGIARLQLTDGGNVYKAVGKLLQTSYTLLRW